MRVGIMFMVSKTERLVIIEIDPCQIYRTFICVCGVGWGMGSGCGNMGARDKVFRSCTPAAWGSLKLISLFIGHQAQSLFRGVCLC